MRKRDAALGACLVSAVALVAFLQFAEGEARAEERAWSAAYARGMEAYRARNYRDAKGEFLEALAQARDTNQPTRHRAQVLDALATTYVSLGQFDAALSYLDESVRLLRQGQNAQRSLELANALSSMAATHERLGMFDEALSALRESREIYAAVFAGGAPVASSEMQVAKHFQLRGNYDQAEQSYLRALSAMEKAPNDLVHVRVLEGYAELLVLLRRHDEAASVLHRAGEIDRSLRLSSIGSRADSVESGHAD